MTRTLLYMLRYRSAHFPVAGLICSLLTSDCDPNSARGHPLSWPLRETDTYGNPRRT